MTIANSGKDENGKYSGGKAGDQTTHEWEIRSWYNRPWNCVLRHPDQAVREDIALLAEHGAANDLIGYDQSQRNTFSVQLFKTKNYDPKEIKTACEADCSSGVLTVVKAVGYRKKLDKLKAINQNGTTHSMRSQLRGVGFEVLTEKKYLESDDYLVRGDILLSDAHHTAINLTKGAKVQSSTSTSNKPTTSGKKTVDQVAQEVLDGKWGNGETRINKLKAAGYDPVAVQVKVNQLMNKASSNKKSVTAIAKEVIAGKWGNGADRKKKLTAAGYDYAAVQKKVNELL